MTAPEAWRVVTAQWRIVVAAMLAGLIVAGVIALVRPPEYSADATLYVSAQRDDSADSAYQGGLLSEQRVKTYSQLVSSPRVTKEVIRRLGLPETAQDVTTRVTATRSPESMVIVVTASDRTDAGAKAIANTVGAVVSELVGELERPSAPGGVQPVAVRLIQPATTATPISSDQRPMLLALGLCIGLAVGIGVALARHRWDTSVRTPDQLRELTGAPGLGTVPFDEEIRDRPVTTRDEVGTPRAESYRQIRTNLQFIDVDHPRKVIIVTSAAPGEGKTTTVIALAATLASAGLRVVVVEADLRRPRIADVLGIEGSVGVTNVLAGRLSAQQALQRVPAAGFHVLTSGPLPPNPSELLSSEKMRGALTALRDRFDIVLVDTPPVLPVTDAAAAAWAADGVVLVCRFGQTRTAQITSAVESLRAVAAPLLGTVLTMAPTPKARAYAPYTGVGTPHEPIYADHSDDADSDATDSLRFDRPEQPVPVRRPSPHRRGQT